MPGPTGSTGMGLYRRAHESSSSLPVGMTTREYRPPLDGSRRRRGAGREHLRNVAQPGSAPGSGPGGRGFKSHHSDQRRATRSGTAAGLKPEGRSCVGVRFPPPSSIGSCVGGGHRARLEHGWRFDVEVRLLQLPPTKEGDVAVVATPASNTGGVMRAEVRLLHLPPMESKPARGRARLLTEAQSNGCGDRDLCSPPLLPSPIGSFAAKVLSAAHRPATAEARVQIPLAAPSPCRLARPRTPGPQPGNGGSTHPQGRQCSRSSEGRAPEKR